MNVLFLGVALLLSLLLVAGWVLLLSMPLVALTAATAGGVARGLDHARQAPARAREAAKGILSLDVPEPALAPRLRPQIARVLKLAPPATRPRACACVKETATGFLGVLRVFNSKGHYLLRVSGESAGHVARSISAALGEFTNVFPAKEGARRIQIPECNPETCPLRRLKRERALAVA